MKQQPPYWEHFEHGADVGVRGVADDLSGAFVQAALAMTAIITDPELVTPSEAVEIACMEPDRELLFVDWLNALIYEMATRRMLFSRFEVRMGGQGELSATAFGEAVDVRRHRPTVEVKGATYTELRVQRRDDGCWVAQCVVDV